MLTSQELMITASASDRWGARTAAHQSQRIPCWR